MNEFRETIPNDFKLMLLKARQSL
ncbi:hypothetical protein BN1007_180042 [Klebsiella variicola]|nr:hypothetical protein BN1007_180042 [Klebsiella variicola]